MNVDDYLALPYRISLVQEPPVEGRPPIWFADVEDLPGCTSQGGTPQEAVESIREAMGAWIADALAGDEAIPEPRTEDDYSGRFIVRAPRSLHALLVREAEREGTSLNQFVTNALSAAVGWRLAGAETILDTGFGKSLVEITPVKDVDFQFITKDRTVREGDKVFIGTVKGISKRERA